MELQNVNLFQRLQAVNKLKHWKQNKNDVV